MLSGNPYGTDCGDGAEDAIPIMPSLASPGVLGDTPLCGDFYRPDDDHITRGVSLAKDSHGNAFLGETPLCGDFYRPDDVTRGVRMAVGDFKEPDEYCTGGFQGYEGAAHSDGYYAMGLGEPFSSYPKLYDDLPHPGSSWGPPSFEDKNFGIKPPGVSRPNFDSALNPPSVPADPFFELETTTLLFSTRGPYVIATDLLKFLEEKVVASITKLTQKKYSVKVNVFMEERMCSMKVRLWLKGGTEYALEFQRRSGDCVMFNRVYQEAASFYQAQSQKADKVYSVTTGTRALPPALPLLPASFGPPALPDDLGILDEADLVPLLDMAKCEGMPKLQAEAAAALADLAKNPANVAALCCDRVFETISALMAGKSMDCEDVALPTARSLGCMARRDQAAKYFARTGFLCSVLDKVGQAATPASAKKELAEAVKAAINTKVCSQMAEGDKDELTKALRRLLTNGEAVAGPYTKEVLDAISDAAITLQVPKGSYVGPAGP